MDRREDSQFYGTVFIMNKGPYHSYRSESAGLATAALTAWNMTVSTEMTRAAKPDIRKISNPIFIL